MADTVFTDLLSVQAHDLRLDQLRHRRESLPERLALAETQATIARLDVELAELDQRSADLHRSQRRLEDEVATLSEKAAETDRKLYSGSVTASKELQALQAEIEALHRRESTLEDEVLELMEAVEPIDTDRDRLESQREAKQAEVAELQGRLLASEAEIDREIEAETAERERAAASVGADLLATYERLRARHDGIAVGRLESGRCTGCHLALPATELDTLRHLPPDQLAYHEECGRIIVR